jgi:hypothetical protein
MQLPMMLIVTPGIAIESGGDINSSICSNGVFDGVYTMKRRLATRVAQ